MKKIRSFCSLFLALSLPFSSINLAYSMEDSDCFTGKISSHFKTTALAIRSAEEKVEELALLGFSGERNGGNLSETASKIRDSQIEVRDEIDNFYKQSDQKVKDFYGNLPISSSSNGRQWFEKKWGFYKEQPSELKNLVHQKHSKGNNNWTAKSQHDVSYSGKLGCQHTFSCNGHYYEGKKTIDAVSATCNWTHHDCLCEDVAKLTSELVGVNDQFNEYRNNVGNFFDKIGSKHRNLSYEAGELLAQTRTIDLDKERQIQFIKGSMGVMSQARSMIEQTNETCLAEIKDKERKVEIARKELLEEYKKIENEYDQEKSTLEKMRTDLQQAIQENNSKAMGILDTYHQKEIDFLTKNKELEMGLSTKQEIENQSKKFLIRTFNKMIRLTKDQTPQHDQQEKNQKIEHLRSLVEQMKKANISDLLEKGEDFMEALDD